MELTEDDIIFTNNYPKKDQVLGIICPPEYSFLELKQQILDDYKKVEKYDQITLRGTRPITADWIREQAKFLFDLEEENKQLKEKLDKIDEKLTSEKANISSAVKQQDSWAVALNDFIDELKGILKKAEHSSSSGVVK